MWIEFTRFYFQCTVKKKKKKKRKNIQNRKINKKQIKRLLTSQKKNG